MSTKSPLYTDTVILPRWSYTTDTSAVLWVTCDYQLQLIYIYLSIYIKQSGLVGFRFFSQTVGLSEFKLGRIMYFHLTNCMEWVSLSFGAVFIEYWPHFYGTNQQSVCKWTYSGQASRPFRCIVLYCCPDLWHRGHRLCSSRLGIRRPHLLPGLEYYIWAVYQGAYNDRRGNFCCGVM